MIKGRIAASFQSHHLLSVLNPSKPGNTIQDYYYSAESYDLEYFVDNLFTTGRLALRLLSNGQSRASAIPHSNQSRTKLIDCSQ